MGVLKFPVMQEKEPFAVPQKRRVAMGALLVVLVLVFIAGIIGL